LGVEKAFTKYVSNVYEDISLDDYISFINKKPNDSMKEQELYKDYVKWFEVQSFLKKLMSSKAFIQKTKNEQNEIINSLFFEKLFEFENDRILYFLLAY
ncbi:MAG: hypothetical protein IJ297_04835, partial [Clostridia bacterium]|nr:hypothetical protein [Clostridia bacterium]